MNIQLELKENKYRKSAASSFKDVWMTVRQLQKELFDFLFMKLQSQFDVRWHTHDIISSQ